MVKYSLNADMLSVFQRLAAAHRGTGAPATRSEEPHAATAASVRSAAPQPRVEIAHVALRRSQSETREAVT